MQEIMVIGQVLLQLITLGSDGTNIQGIANILAEYYGIRPVITIPKYVLGID